MRQLLRSGLEGMRSGSRGAPLTFAAAAAAASAEFRRPAADLAALVWDGDLDPGLPPGWARCERGGVQERLLCFERDGFTAAIRVCRTGRRRLRGVIAPVPRPRLRLQRPSAVSIDVRPDDDGAFGLPWIPSGPVRLWVCPVSDVPIVTSWVLLD